MTSSACDRAGPRYRIQLLRNILVPISGGAELACDVYLPEGAGRCPTLVSPTPYRKDDYIGSAWQHVITYFVERGYAHVVADFRGLGSSSGIAAEAMSDSEAGDGVELVEWAASQPWSDGRVGMYGVSYGGISALRTAAARPPHLRAIIPLLATADPYDDFVYPGGCFNCLGVAAWSSYMHAMQMAPPMYQDPERRWYTVWQTRLEHTEPLVVPWLEHPERDAFWRAKSIALELIEVPTFLIGGWRDIFPDAMPRAYERLGVPRKLWMGPWPHVAPDSAPIEAVEYLPVMCRWFDRFLREEHNGIDTEPPVTLFVQGEGSGWTHEDEWPIPRARVRTFFAEKDGGLVDEPVDPDGSIWYVADPTVGTQAGLWDVRGTGIGLPLDQRPDDDRSLTFTTQPLTRALEITGRPEARLSLVIVEGRDANIVVKICDVAPDGFSTLVTTGWLRAVHRSSHERVEPITADQPLEARVPLWATSYRVPVGHRLRMSVSCADFPRIWPSRTNARLRLATGGGSLVRLPVVPPGGQRGRRPNRPRVRERPRAWCMSRLRRGATK